ncbi:hypothetical protein FVE85_6879 [Porphyridium purpureum]|uniref:Uncharacterized protein n=1 Tax=Porphyridium purpureum TaxID=35688 RepID=A0A5J4Z8I8_PORPP|nr:hypothetical protein FVE85_6879 [Porphyridium purpureum]|eukprot:POR2899..scf295_1
MDTPLSSQLSVTALGRRAEQVRIESAELEHGSVCLRVWDAFGIGRARVGWSGDAFWEQKRATGCTEMRVLLHLKSLEGFRLTSKDGTCLYAHPPPREHAQAPRAEDNPVEVSIPVDILVQADPQGEFIMEYVDYYR